MVAATTAAGEPVVNTMPLSVSTEAGCPCWTAVSPKRADMSEGLDMCVRRSGGSSGERSGREVKSVRNGKWSNSDPYASLVSFAASGEEVPAELRYASKERMIAVECGWAQLDRWRRRQLRQVGRARQGRGPFASPLECLSSATRARSTPLAELRAGSTLSVSSRGSVARTLGERTTVVRAGADRRCWWPLGRLAGARLIVEAAVTLGTVTLDEGNETLAAAVEATVKTMDLYYRHHLQVDTSRLTSKRFLDLLREPVASGRRIIGAFGEVQPGQTLPAGSSAARSSRRRAKSLILTRTALTLAALVG